jgi:opacity protein-like surface antigen
MTRFALAAVLAVALAQSASAQPAPITLPVPGAVLPPPPPPALYRPDVYIPPGTPAGPAIPFIKSNGVIAGAYGFYPYDSGDWMLGGTLGLYRSSGSFTMVYPQSVSPTDAAGCKRGLLRR